MDNSLIVDGLNIAELTDDELSERLQNLGFIPGPILASTRSVYQRKLARLLRNEELEDLETNDDASHSLTSPPRPVLNSTFQSSSPSSFNYDELRRRPLPRVGENITSKEFKHKHEDHTSDTSYDEHSKKRRIE